MLYRRDELPRVLLVSPDVVGKRMSGPGIRYWNLAHVLARYHHVTLAIPNKTNMINLVDGLNLVSIEGLYSTKRGAVAFEDLISEHDVIVSQYLPFRYLNRELLDHKFLVFDLYSPWIVENLEYARIDPEDAEIRRGDDYYVLTQILSLGDFFICASKRQRDYWLGALTACGRRLIHYYQSDAQLRSLIDVVSFGLPNKPPKNTRRVMRSQLPHIVDTDCIVLWGGGIWNWLDPLSAIFAMAELVKWRSDVKLVFLGYGNHHTDLPMMKIAKAALALSKELDLYNQYVFFVEWIPYSERSNYLLEADIGLSLHRATYESRLCFRTRVMDYLWGALPVIVTEGDVLSDLVKEHEFGIVVPPEDIDALANAIDLLSRSPELGQQYKANASLAAKEYTWECVAKPLLAYCKAPYSYRERHCK